MLGRDRQEPGVEGARQAPAPSSMRSSGATTETDSPMTTPGHDPFEDRTSARSAAIPTRPPRSRTFLADVHRGAARRDVADRSSRTAAAVAPRREAAGAVDAVRHARLGPETDCGLASATPATEQTSLGADRPDVPARQGRHKVLDAVVHTHPDEAPRPLTDVHRLRRAVGACRRRTPRVAATRTDCATVFARTPSARTAGSSAARSPRCRPSTARGDYAVSQLRFATCDEARRATTAGRSEAAC